MAICSSERRAGEAGGDASMVLGEAGAVGRRDVNGRSEGRFDV
jgi:hypothetical protein